MSTTYALGRNPYRKFLEGFGWHEEYALAS